MGTLRAAVQVRGDREHRVDVTLTVDVALDDDQHLPT